MKGVSREGERRGKGRGGEREGKERKMLVCISLTTEDLSTMPSSFLPSLPPPRLPLLYSHSPFDLPLGNCVGSAELDACSLWWT